MIQNRSITGLVLLNDRSDQCNQLVPELQIILPGSSISRVDWLIGSIALLEFPVVELETVFVEELVGGSETGDDAVFDDGAGSGWTGQFLDLKLSKE